MSTLALVLAGLVLGIAVHQLICAVLFIRVMLRRPDELAADEELPKTAVLMGVRGVDPDMPIGLQKLMQQDYPNYELRIVIDGPEDSAWDAVRTATERTGAKHVFAENYESDSRDGAVNSTNSKVMQAMRKLDDSFEIIAMADGDMMPHDNWLRELVSPLVRDERIGATFGNRWFVSATGSLGSLIRYLWNVPAVAAMYFFGMPWGGCFAIRTEVIDRCGFRRKWPQVLALDAASPGDLKKHGLRVHFVPTLMMPNREECRVGFCVNFIQRQLLWTRLYHPGWPLAAGYGMVATIIPVVALLFAGGFLMSGRFAEGAILLGVVTAHLLSSWLLLPVTEWAVRRRMRERHELSPFTFGRWLRLAMAIPITHVVQMLALVRAIFARRVRWRGIILEIHGRNEIRMIDEQAPVPTEHADLALRESL